MANSHKKQICSRISQIRRELFGPRGKSSFAEKLGLSPSTYDYYENERVPPADVLVAIADLAGVDLKWLITGQQSTDRPLPADHPVIQRAAALLAEKPNAAAALSAFLEILTESLKFPAAKAAPRRKGQTKDGSDGDEQASWLPILGRSAAGVPQFWSDTAETKGTIRLGDLIATHAAAAGRQTRQGRAEQTDAESETNVQIITVRPGEVAQPVEFVAAKSIKSRWPDAFVVRMDGESMSPDICHGDLVVLSPSAPAADGRPAVIQLEGQIGVTCKLYRQSKGHVHLVPINEQFAPQSFPAKNIVWALRVLAKIRPE